MKFNEGMGLYFTGLYCIYKGLVQAGWLLVKNCLHIFGALYHLHLTKASKLAVTTGQNRPKGHGKMPAATPICFKCEGAT